MQIQLLAGLIAFTSYMTTKLEYSVVLRRQQLRHDATSHILLNCHDLVPICQNFKLFHYLAPVQVGNPPKMDQSLKIKIPMQR